MSGRQPATSDDAAAERADTEEKVSDPLEPKIAVTLAVVVVIAGMLAVLQTQAGANESTTARETTRTAVRAMSANVARSTLLGVRSVVEAEHEFLPFRRPLDANAPSLEEAAGLAAQPDSVSSDLRAAQRLPTRQLLSELAPLQLDAERQVLKQQALATTRVTWNTRLRRRYTTRARGPGGAPCSSSASALSSRAIRRVTYGLGVAIRGIRRRLGSLDHPPPDPVHTRQRDYRGCAGRCSHE